MSKQKLDQSPNKKWDVIFDDGDTHLKARVKAYTTRDGMAKRALETALAVRFPEAPADAPPTDADVEALLLINQYPLIKFGVAEAVGFALPLSEEDFWKLPEAFTLELGEAIRKRNAQYAIPFLELRRLIAMYSDPNFAKNSTDTPPSETSDKTP